LVRTNQNNTKPPKNQHPFSYLSPNKYPIETLKNSTQPKQANNTTTIKIKINKNKNKNKPKIKYPTKNQDSKAREKDNLP